MEWRRARQRWGRVIQAEISQCKGLKATKRNSKKDTVAGMEWAKWSTWRDETREVGGAGRIISRSLDVILRMVGSHRRVPSRRMTWSYLLFKRSLCLTVWQTDSSRARVEAGKPAETEDIRTKAGSMMAFRIYTLSEQLSRVANGRREEWGKEQDQMWCLHFRPG